MNYYTYLEGKSNRTTDTVDIRIEKADFQLNRTDIRANIHIYRPNSTIPELEKASSMVLTAGGADKQTSLHCRLTQLTVSITD